jgi:sucrose-6-phosphate hydrolase SacC (GH32 family)
MTDSSVTNQGNKYETRQWESIQGHDAAAVSRAMAAIEDARSHAEEDPERPVYHFRPPAQWMNDINGPLYHKGYYHIFYQHNPYADTWGHVHWGHARS